MTMPCLAGSAKVCHHPPMLRALVLALSILAACQPHGVVLPDDSEAPNTRDTQLGDTGPETIPDAWEPPLYDPSELPAEVPRINIILDAAALARLDADPFHAPDEQGVFIDGEGVSHEVDISYRGAYALLSVMTTYDLRNWKIKFSGDDRHLDRREWNFNYEPHLNQKLAYDLMRFSGVAVPSAQHVILELNGEVQGLYLQYEDPDNRHWLYDQLGDDEGDLYKAAYDLPDETQYFGDLTVLGDTDADFLLHYNKKLGAVDDDYSVLRTFIDELNTVSDADFPAWFDTYVDVERFRSYLVVSNFMANWDSYPQRPKNYWLYQDSHAERMVYIPWDMDGTFNPTTDGTYNQMGTGVSVLYNLREQEYRPPHASEGWERPLVHRMMALEGQREAYLERYRELSGTILSADYLLGRIDSLSALVEPDLTSADRGRMQGNVQQARSFVQQRCATVEAELEGL